MTSATYLLRDISSIKDLENLLCKIWEDVKESLPSDCNGLALEMNDKPKRKRKANGPTEENKSSARKKRKIQQLPKGKYGRPKHRYTGRVGQSAEMLRKGYKVNIPVESFNEGTLQKRKAIDLRIISLPIITMTIDLDFYAGGGIVLSVNMCASNFTNKVCEKISNEELDGAYTVDVDS